MTPSAATLVTGASSGLGEEFARMAAADRSNVVLVARSLDKLNALAAALERDYGVRATVLAEDLADDDAPDVIADALAARHVEIDTLINNAGFGTYGPFAETSLADERQMIAVNIAALTMLTKRLVPGMVARRRGRILNVASTAAFQPGPLMAVYYASKAYVLSLSEALATELEETGVTVTCLCPGPTLTAFQARAGMQRSGLFKAMKVMDAATVAREGYEGMKAGRTLVIPGVLNRLGVQAIRVSPRSVVPKVVRAMQRER
jgi:short-subunit dehydrogenase